MSQTQQLKYYTIKPPEALIDFVQYFWVLEGEASLANPFIHRCIANTGAEWLFHYRGYFDELIGNLKKQNSFLTGVDGLSNNYTRYVAESPFGIFGVHLYPYALQALFGVPASSLINQSIDVYSFAKEPFPELDEKIFSAKDNNERFGVVCRFLETRLLKPDRPEVAYIVKVILNAGGDVDIHKLADQCFLSLRQFQRVFKEQTGFSPKSFARLARFNAVLGQTRHNSYREKESLTAMAYRFGYYDQSHFIQDFKTYTGYTPKTFFKGRATELVWAG